MEKNKTEQYRQLYPKGTQIELISMDDDFTNLKQGDKGIIQLVDDIGNVHVNWENGSKLALVPEVDSFKIISNKSEIETVKFNELKDKFKEEYSYLDIPEDNIIQKFANKALNIDVKVDLLAGYVLSGKENSAEIEESYTKEKDDKPGYPRGDEPTKIIEEDENIEEKEENLNIISLGEITSEIFENNKEYIKEQIIDNFITQFKASGVSPGLAEDQAKDLWRENYGEFTYEGLKEAIDDAFLIDSSFTVEIIK